MPQPDPPLPPAPHARPPTARPSATHPARTEALAVIHLHPQAPAKPPAGAACNGCGACCAWQPCPIGMLVSRRRRGACRALQWQAAADDASPAVDAASSGDRYACGVLLDPAGWLWLLRPLPVAWARRLVRRWIAAGAGCDAGIEMQTPGLKPGAQPGGRGAGA